MGSAVGTVRGRGEGRDNASATLLTTPGTRESRPGVDCTPREMGDKVSDGVIITLLNDGVGCKWGVKRATRGVSSWDL